jgi:hypothetical protein
MTTTTMATADELEQAARDAAAEAAEAEQLVATLEERVLDGDDDVQPEQIEAQRNLSRFARLRAEGARRKVERAEQARQSALIEELDAAVRTACKPGGRLSHRREVDALAQFRTAVGKAANTYAAAMAAQQECVGELVQAARTAGVPEGLQSELPVGTPRYLSGEQLVTPAGIVSVSGRYVRGEHNKLMREAAAAINEAVRR